MTTIKQFGAILVILFIGILIGALGFKAALFIFPIPTVIWFMSWEEKSYSVHTEETHEQHYSYHQ